MIRGGLVTLSVADVGRAVRFYVETLGLKLIEDGGEDGCVVDAGEGFRIRLSRGRPAAGSAVTLLSKVPIDEAIAIYENRGVTFVVERSERGTVAELRDPDGNALRLAQG